MDGKVYGLIALALAVALLSLYGVLALYTQLESLNSRIFKIDERLRAVNENLLNLSETLKGISREDNATCVIVHENLTAPELVYEAVKDSVVMIRVTVLRRTHIKGKRMAKRRWFRTGKS